MPRTSSQRTQTLTVREATFRALNLLQKGQLQEAERLLLAVLKVRPDYFDALHLQGLLLARRNNSEGAIRLFRRALKLRPRSAEVHSDLGVSLQRLGLHLDAIACFDRALEINPDHVNALYNRGVSLAWLQRHGEALASFDTALAIQADHLGALSHRGLALANLDRHTEAIASYEQVLAVRPDHAQALNNLVGALGRQNRLQDAIPYYEKALAINPDSDYALGGDAYCRAQVCDWKGYLDRQERLISNVRSGKRASMPFLFIAQSDNAGDQRTCAATYVRDQCPPQPQPLWNGERYKHDRIRVAYVSADFHDHATAHLMAELFELHDRTRFEVTAVSFGPDAPGEMRTRLKRAFERFIDVRQRSDRDIARLIRELEIDIAVDLKGFTTGSRTGIFALRPAPIQVNYLGYPGSMGSDYFDYVLADRIVIPEQDRPHYSENVVFLPDCYQVNDSKRRVAERTPARAEVGLPEQGFVFCCFNNSYKVTPTVFDVWIRLLRHVEGSALWLLEDNAAAVRNLRCEAEARGIDPNRLVFAPRVKLAEHLARHRCADLFLDTLPYNAHTTASDALWTGLPVVTCAGTTFAGRVAASLLNAIGLSELIARSMLEYETLALNLATDGNLLRHVREKLARNRVTAPLFNTVRFKRHIETAFIEMWETYQRGEKPRGFAVAPCVD